MPRPPFFPMMIDIAGQKVLVVGGGHIASRRAVTLMKCGAEIHAVSPAFCEEFPEVSERITRCFVPDDVTGDFALVIAATNDRHTNSLVHITAKTKHIPVNVADCPGECDFFFPSLIASGSAAVSVCSAGTSSRLTRRLSDRLRKVWASWVSEDNEN